MKKWEVCVNFYKFVSVEAKTEKEALEIVNELAESINIPNNFEKEIADIAYLGEVEE